MLKKLIKVIAPLLIVVVAVMIARGMIGSRQQLEPSGAQQPLPQVQTIDVQLSDVSIALVSHGNVTAGIELDLASEVTGRVVGVAPNFEPGEKVAADTVLLNVDSVSYQLAVAEAEAALASAQTALANAKALRQRASITEAELNIKAIQQRIAKAKQDLSYTEIRAPFAAVIDRQLVEIGQFVTTGQTVARLLSTDVAEVSLPYTVAEAGLLGEPAATEVEISADIGAKRRTWQASLLRVESRVEQESRTVPVVVQVDSPYDTDVHPQPLPLGAFVRASITSKPIAAAVQLPNSVLQGGESVYVVQNGELQRRKISIVHRQGNDIVVNGGLQTGDRVLLTRLDVMFEGMRVQVHDQAEAANTDA